MDRNYESEIVEIKDVTNENEKNLFLEHLYHMVNPYWTSEIIDNFISKAIDFDNN